jgi:hypothetical protein
MFSSAFGLSLKIGLLQWGILVVKDQFIGVIHILKNANACRFGICSTFGKDP